MNWLIKNSQREYFTPQYVHLQWYFKPILLILFASSYILNAEQVQTWCGALFLPNTSNIAALCCLSALWCFITGDTDRVPRKHGGAAQCSSLVDHTGGCSRRHLDFGPVGIPAVEGEHRTMFPRGVGSEQWISFYNVSAVVHKRMR